jgi:hypothetical protein
VMWQRIKLIVEWIFDQFIYPLIAPLLPAARKSAGSQPENQEEK